MERRNNSATKFDRVEITLIFFLGGGGGGGVCWLKPNINEVGGETSVPREII